MITVGAWILRRFYHPHHHAHKIDSTKGVIAIGLSTGLIPCPATLVVLLVSIANNQVYNGLWYILVFSIGLAISIVSLSVLMVKGRGFIQSYMRNKRVNSLPFISDTIIIIIGIFTLLHPLFEQLETVH